MDPLTLMALFGAGAQIYSNISSGNKEDAYAKKTHQRDMQTARRNALQNAIGSRSNGVINSPNPPDLSGDRILGAVGQALGAAGIAGMSRKPSSAAPQGISMVGNDDPQEAIRRRLGGDYGIA